jgi:protein SCO1/2
MRRRRLVRNGLLLAAVAPVWLLAGCDRPPATAAGTAAPPQGGSTAPAPAPGAKAFHGIDITGAKYARNFALADPSGKVRTLDEFKGKVTVVFFGFTQCPDVCPTTMAELAQIRQSLGAEGERLQGIFVTVDPERDTPELLDAYVKNFDPSFVALRGDATQTEAVAREFKVYFAKVPGRNTGSYTIDHTAGAYVFDPQGRVRLFVRHGTGATAMADDIRRLIGGA